MQWVSLHAPSLVMGGNTEIITVSPDNFHVGKHSCKEISIPNFIGIIK